jgi:hypothetical protein
MKLKVTTKLHSIKIMVKLVKTPKIIDNCVGRHKYLGSRRVALRGKLENKWRWVVRFTLRLFTSDTDQPDTSLLVHITVRRKN